MAQFDIYRNPGRSKAVIPFLLAVQSDRWEASPDRAVVPLVLAGELGYRDRTLNPEFTIDGMAVIMDPLQVTTIPVRVLGPAVVNLGREHIRVIAALDSLITQGR